MKMLSIVAALLVLIGAGLALVPDFSRHLTILLAVTLAGGLVSLLTAILSKRETAPAPTVKSAQPPLATRGTGRSAEAEIAAFVGLLQEKGRLVDFLMDDVTPFTDAQIGAAARVVHQGCQSVLREHFAIEPVSSEPEGSPISLPEGYPAKDYRLLGHVGGSAPYQGTLVHKGWKATKIKVPKVTALGAGELPTIAPAQVELA